MSQIAELEQRITSALARISAGIEAMAVPVIAPQTAAAAANADDLARLQEALDEERMANAQLGERMKSLRDQGEKTGSAATAEIAALTRQLDAQGLDVQRLSATVGQLREDLRRLREAAEQGMADPQMINRAMMAELEALRATRVAETNEMAEILSALQPIIEAEEVRAHA